MNNDKLTTILGGAVAATTAAQVVVGQMDPGSSLHSGDWFQLAAAVLMAVFGFFTNRGGK